MAFVPPPFNDLEAPQTDPVKIQGQLRILNQRMKDTPLGTPFYLRVTGGEPGERTSAANVMQLGHYVNPELAQHSDYFKSLNQMMQCVEKNAHVHDVQEQARVCDKEFRNLRLAAFN